VTALAGQVLRLNGQPLAQVSLSIGSTIIKTDANGEFLLENIPSGKAGVGDRWCQRKRRASSIWPYYEYRAAIEAGQTNVLPSSSG